MSKNISIQENGVAQTLNTISVVETKGSPSGSVDWVPEDECQLGQVVVKSNGEITASEEGFYAFSKVAVNVPAEECKAVGMNEDGEWEVWGVDEDGELVELGLPTRIEVVTPPNKTSYIVGEPINPKGMVVMGYFEDDSEYGIISLDEITLDPIIAVDVGEESATSDLNTNGLDKPFAITEASSCAEGLWSWTFEKKCRFTSGLTAKKSSSNQFQGFWVAASETPFSVTSYINGIHNDTSEALIATISGKTVYYSYTQGGFSEDLRPNLNDLGEYRALDLRCDNIAWTMVYGTITGGSEVDVKWERQDGEELTSSFDINVDPIFT